MRPVVEMESKISIGDLLYDTTELKTGTRRRQYLKRFLTADEAWLYNYDLIIKQQNSEWKELSINTLSNRVQPSTARTARMSCEQWYNTLKRNLHGSEMASYCTMTMPNHILLIAYSMLHRRTT
ncbi:hypothetical protein TNCV_1550301 [Trichonephila clavipes]|uniref:Uncharacterized protein n=1 Tax=Trichonephila clavipes TaxID=2585209 RepID=A0A8X6RXT2_TRICX|nr:hypothetical protein TNCV_1550301 [Trichonephila clavipes]